MSVLITRRRFGALVGAIPVLPLASASASASPVTHEVAIRQFEFDPAELVIAADDRVKWTNLDFAPHTATAVDGEWDTGGLEKRDAATITFDATGEFAYFCAFHPHMKGTIVVQA